MDIDEIRTGLKTFTKGLVTNTEIVNRVNNMVRKYELKSEQIDYLIDYTYCCSGDDWETCGVINALRDAKNNLE